MRAFFGIALPDAASAALAALQDELRRGGLRAAWVRPENLHLTLRFLGEIDEAACAAVAEAAGAACAGFAPIEIAVRGTGLFAPPRHAPRPAVLWADAAAPEPLYALQRALEAAACGGGLAPERKPFRTHITLARVKEPAQIAAARQAATAHAGFEAGAFAAAHVTLWESALGRGGPTYRAIREFPLACTPPT